MEDLLLRLWGIFKQITEFSHLITARVSIVQKRRRQVRHVPGKLARGNSDSSFSKCSAERICYRLKLLA